MLKKRLIPCLDVDRGRVVKGTQFVNIKDAGDPIELAIRYEKEGADELVFLDISASHEGRNTMYDMVEKVAKSISIPFTVGGGVKSVEDIQRLLEIGADKVGINSAALSNPELIAESSNYFGSQCIVLAIDARRNDNSWEVYTHGGRKGTGIDAIEWAKICAELGAGEILLTSMDRDGTNSGYDIPLTNAIIEAVNIPVIASGGVGRPEDFVEVFVAANADAALAASIFHFETYSVSEIKKLLQNTGIAIRTMESYS